MSCSVSWNAVLHGMIADLPPDAKCTAPLPVDWGARRDGTLPQRRAPGTTRSSPDSTRQHWRPPYRQEQADSTLISSEAVPDCAWKKKLPSRRKRDRCAEPKACRRQKRRENLRLDANVGKGNVAGVNLDADKARIRIFTLRSTAELFIRI